MIIKARGILLSLALLVAGVWSTGLFSSDSYSLPEYILYNHNKRINIIFLHGAFASAESFFHLAEYPKIKALANTYHVSLRNHGGSADDLVSPLRNTIQDIYNLIKHEGLDSVYLVGHSLGARTAMEFTIRYPHLVRGLLSINVLPMAFPQDVRDALNGVVAGLKSVNLQQSFEAIEAEVKNLVKDDIFAAYIMRQLESVDGKFRWTFNIDGLQLYNRVFEKPLSRRIYNRVRIIGGKRSFFFPVDRIPEAVQFFPRLDIDKDVDVVDTSHFVYVEKPEAVVDAIVKLITQ